MATNVKSSIKPVSFLGLRISEHLHIYSKKKNAKINSIFRTTNRLWCRLKNEMSYLIYKKKESPDDLSLKSHLVF